MTEKLLSVLRVEYTNLVSLRDTPMSLAYVYVGYVGTLKLMKNSVMQLKSTPETSEVVADISSSVQSAIFLMSDFNQKSRMTGAAARILREVTAHYKRILEGAEAYKKSELLIALKGDKPADQDALLLHSIYSSLLDLSGLKS